MTPRADRLDELLAKIRILHLEAGHDAIVRLGAWLSHSRNCARVTMAEPCDCGLQAELATHRWSI